MRILSNNAESTMNVLILAALGIVAGLLSGYLGVGAAIVMIPVLTALLDFDQKTAQSISLTVMVPMALVGAVLYRYQFRLAPPLGPIGILAGAAVAGSVLGSVLASHSPARHLKLAFALFVIATGVVLLLKALQEKTP
jgi:uncharacterized membrane protein YfcA